MGMIVIYMALFFGLIQKTTKFEASFIIYNGYKPTTGEKYRTLNYVYGSLVLWFLLNPLFMFLTILYQSSMRFTASLYLLEVNERWKNKNKKTKRCFLTTSDMLEDMVSSGDGLTKSVYQLCMDVYNNCTESYFETNEKYLQQTFLHFSLKSSLS